MNKKIVAVLTGDIVDSQKIAPQDYDNMLYTLESTFSMLATQTEMKFDLFRGDAFQGVFADAKASINAAIVVRLALKITKPALSARQSIGIGGVTLLRADTKSSTGEAFVLSGTGLDKMKGELLSVHSQQQNFQDKLALLTKFVDNHLAGLTAIQAEVLLCYLTSVDKSHQAIASNLNKTRSNVTRLLNACHYQLVVDYINHFRLCITQEFADE